MAETDREFIRGVVSRNRYLSLATTDGSAPWIAPLEYLWDEEFNLYFLSPENAAHSRHLEGHPQVAVTIFDAAQPEYRPAPVMRIAGVQLTGLAHRLKAPFPSLVTDQIAAWKLPIPPYAAYRVVPERWWIPVIRDGVNDRVEVAMV